ncbi:MAG: glycosyltransferase [Thermoplasmata archaeon]|nr:glycosyltransferase [Thermoplasmata archaeon]
MSARARAPQDVAVVCPTYQEGGTIGPFLERVRTASGTFRSARLTELIFVDDGSTDGTVERVREAERTWTSPRVRLVQRAQKAGTVSAQIAGFQHASTELVATMDADGQHPAETIDRLAEAWESSVDLVVASRYVPGGTVQWEERRRGVISRGARSLSRLVLPGARRLRDPLSGFFLARRSWVAELPPAPPGYKLLLYVLAIHPRSEIREIPYEMGMRLAGESKLIRGLGFIPSFLRELARYRRAGATAHRRARSTSK